TEKFLSAGVLPCLILPYSPAATLNSIIFNTQTPLNLQVAAGEEGMITCRYKTSIFNSLQWYKQLSNARPEHILTSVVDGILTKNNIKVSLNKSEQFSVMSILNSEIQDSATYFCAVETRCV
uniref:Ig-like domain-containing protein n=1 Tax=Erpetoichthys calabaricus TaxID=27687 RepID=A0A8C4SBE4_ERPCA